jgi:hypothetical protein
MSLKSKSPSNRPTRAASVISSEECLFDVFARKASKVDFVKAVKPGQRKKLRRDRRTYTTLDGCQIFQHRTITANTVNPTIHLTSPLAMPISLPVQCSFLPPSFPVRRAPEEDKEDGPYTCCLSRASASESGL